MLQELFSRLEQQNKQGTENTWEMQRSDFYDYLRDFFKGPIPKLVVDKLIKDRMASSALVLDLFSETDALETLFGMYAKPGVEYVGISASNAAGKFRQSEMRTIMHLVGDLKQAGAWQELLDVTDQMRRFDLIISRGGGATEQLTPPQTEQYLLGVSQLLSPAGLALLQLPPQDCLGTMSFTLADYQAAIQESGLTLLHGEETNLTGMWLPVRGSIGIIVPSPTVNELATMHTSVD